MSLDEPVEPEPVVPDVEPELPVPMSLEEPLDLVPSEPELELEPFEPAVSRSLVVWPDALPLDPVDPVDPLLSAKAGAVATRSPAIPRPPTTPHPIFIRIPSLLLRLETDQAFVPWHPSCWLPER